MIKVCAWCKKVKAEEIEPLDDKSVTHGICEECLAKENAKLDELKKHRR